MFYAPYTQVPHVFTTLLEKAGLLISEPESADYLLVPFGFEFAIEYSEEDYRKLGFPPDCKKHVLATLENLKVLSPQMGKPLVVIHYRNSPENFNLPDSIVFRTSAFGSRSEKNTYGVPLFVEGFPQLEEPWEPLKKTAKPSLSFMGLAAPVKMGWKLQARMLANNLLKMVDPKFGVKTWYPETYFLRRRAAVALLNSPRFVQASITINPDPASNSYKIDYQHELYGHPLILCVAGHGNYSFRFYETMRAGRNPVFGHTDCVLPCRDEIPWKDLVLWVEENEVSKLPRIISEFYASIHPDDFLERQHAIRAIYNEYLTVDGFTDYLIRFCRRLTEGPIPEAAAD